MTVRPLRNSVLVMGPVSATAQGALRLCTDAGPGGHGLMKMSQPTVSADTDSSQPLRPTSHGEGVELLQQWWNEEKLQAAAVICFILR